MKYRALVSRSLNFRVGDQGLAVLDPARPVRGAGRSLAGGMGEIYLACDRVLGRTVAVKLLAEAVGAGAELRERFRRGGAGGAAWLSGEPTS